MQRKPEPGELVHLGATFVEDRSGRALIRLPNGSKTSVDYGALRPKGGKVHFVDQGHGEEASCLLCDWHEAAASRVVAEDRYVEHLLEEHATAPDPAQSHLTDDELNAIALQAHAASPGPWESDLEGRDHWSGDDFIRIGGLDDEEPDMYVTHELVPADSRDLDFIANSRQDVLRLIAEVRRLRSILADSPKR